MRYLWEDFVPLGSSSRKTRKAMTQAATRQTHKQTFTTEKELCTGTTDRAEGCPPSSSCRLRSHLGASWMGVRCCVTSAPLERKNCCIHEMLGVFIVMHRAQQGNKSTAQSCLIIGNPLSLFYPWHKQGCSRFSISCLSWMKIIPWRKGKLKQKASLGYQAMAAAKG